MEKASQDRREKNASYQPEIHVRNANSREIFKNNRLTSQFLRNYTNIPLLSNVMPEDIEDVSEKYQAFLGVEFESDTIKKVYIRKADGIIEREVYVLSLIEHKSDIDYDVAMQLLRYMCVIWQEYKATQNKINKIQSAEDLSEFRKVSEEMVESIYGNAPDEIKEIYKKILWSLLMKLKVPNEETSNIIGEIGGRGMGYLFENMDEMDIQAERRNTAREKKRADALEEEVKRLRKLLEIQGQK